MSTLMKSWLSGPRRRNCGRLNVALDYHAGIAIGVLIPAVTFPGIRCVLFSDEYMSSHSGDGIIASAILVVVLVLLSEVLLFLVVFGDPGILPPGEVTAVSHMCPVCLVEVDEFDHHCFFLSSCIGKGNYKYFFCFALSAALLCATGFLLALNYCRIIALQEGLIAKIVESKWRAPVTAVKILCSNHVRVLAVFITVLCAYATLFAASIVSLYSFFTIFGRHSLHRRRRRCAGGGCRAVFAQFFQPKLTRPEVIAQYRDAIACV